MKWQCRPIFLSGCCYSSFVVASSNANISFEVTNKHGEHYSPRKMFIPLPLQKINCLNFPRQKINTTKFPQILFFSLDSSTVLGTNSSGINLSNDNKTVLMLKFSISWIIYLSEQVLFWLLLINSTTQSHNWGSEIIIGICSKYTRYDINLILIMLVYVYPLMRKFSMMRGLTYIIFLVLMRSLPNILRSVNINLSFVDLYFGNDWNNYVIIVSEKYLNWSQTY